MVDQIKEQGLPWREIKPIQLRRLLKQYTYRGWKAIDRVHFVDHGDYLVTELKPKGQTNGNA